MARAEEKRIIPMRYNPAIMIITARTIEQIRGIRLSRRNVTIGPITNANRRAMVKGRTMGAIIFKTAPPIIRAIKATRKKFALPELKLLNLSFILLSMA
jgi:hypothetical protein